MHSYNSQSQHDRGANSSVEEVISRDGAIQEELVLTLIQATHILQEKKASPSKYINPVTHRVISRTKALIEQQTTCKLIAAGTVPVPPPELGAGQVL